MRMAAHSSSRDCVIVDPRQWPGCVFCRDPDLQLHRSDHDQRYDLHPVLHCPRPPLSPRRPQLCCQPHSVQLLSIRRLATRFQPVRRLRRRVRRLLVALLIALLAFRRDGVDVRRLRRNGRYVRWNGRYGWNGGYGRHGGHVRRHARGSERSQQLDEFIQPKHPNNVPDDRKHCRCVWRIRPDA